MGRLDYILKRMVMAIFVMISVSILTFFIARVVPSNPAAAWVGPHPTKEQIEKATLELGLDKPLYVQYQRYMQDLLSGDLGTSVRTHQPILSDIKTYLPATLELVLVGMLVATLVGIPLGVLSGAFKGSWLDHLTRLVSIAGVSMPAFLLGLLLQLLFFRQLGMLPLGARLSTEVSLFYPVTPITRMYLIDSAVTGNWTAFKDASIHIILPALALATYPIALAIRMTRSTIIEVLNEKYIMAARISGIRERTVLFILALKNAIVPTLNALGLAFVYSLTGAILIEIIFSWPGLGTYVTNAVLSVDFPVIVSVTLIMTVFYIAINLILDVLQAFIDPRVIIG
ncbi:MAG: ABC transporter permease [Anaerolineales bacterium]